MSVNYRIAQIADKEILYQYAEDKLKLQYSDSMELMMKVWESRFRLEALDHYLKMGWSFVALNENQKVVGFFLGQPFLFFEAQTQTLWIELLLADDYKIESELAEIAIKLSRDKHLQRVILPKSTSTLHYEKPYQFNDYKSDCVWVKTTK